METGIFRKPNRLATYIQTQRSSVNIVVAAVSVAV